MAGLSVDPLWVGVDAGGTKILAGVVDDAGAISRTATGATPGLDAAPEAVEDAIIAAVTSAVDGAPLAGVGLGAAGFVDAAAEVVRFAPHLPWRDHPARQRLADRLGVPVTLDNDANCAAVGEAAYGAARGAPSALLVALGTGIGGAVLFDGELWRGAQGMAGEFGHMIVVPNGRSCECGRQGCWEQYCSGTALARAAGSTLGTGRDVTAAARAGDPAALAAFDEIGGWLGRGVAGLVAAFDPERVVIGGGVVEAGDLLLEPARRALADALVGGSHRNPVPLVAAELGAQAGIVGAAVLARRAVVAARRTVAP